MVDLWKKYAFIFQLHASRWDLMARDQFQPHFVEISFFSNIKVQQQNP